MGLADCRLVMMNPDGSDGIIYVPENDTIKVGCNPQCDIRFIHDNLKREHFRIYIDKFGKVKFFFSKPGSIVINCSCIL